MGSSKSKVAALPSENATEETNGKSHPKKTTRTGCFVGIKKVFSRKTKVSRSDADDDDDHFNDDDGQLQQTTTTASVVPASSKPAELHRHLPKAVRCDPIGQIHMPIISQAVKSSPVIGQKFRSGRPSTSHPADIRVSSGYFLYYHRYVNDDSDKESLDEDTSDNEPVFDADIESEDDQDKTTAPKMVMRPHRRSAHSGKRGKTPKSGFARVKGKKSAKVCDDVSSDDDETSHVTRQRKRVKKTKLKVIEQHEADAVRDNEATSRVDTDIVDKMNLFLASLSVVVASLPVAMAITEALVFLEIAKQMENEKHNRDDKDFDQGTVVEAPDAGARTLSETCQWVQEDDIYESEWETFSSSESDSDQPSISYLIN